MVSLRRRLALSSTGGLPELLAKPAISVELKVAAFEVVVTELILPWTYETHLLVKTVARSARVGGTGRHGQFERE
jgi:hypothetical protein